MTVPLDPAQHGAIRVSDRKSLLKFLVKEKNVLAIRIPRLGNETARVDMRDDSCLWPAMLRGNPMFAIAPYLNEIAYHKTETGVDGAKLFCTAMAPLANLHFATAFRHDTIRKIITVNRTDVTTTGAFQLPFGFTTCNYFRKIIRAYRVRCGRDNFPITEPTFRMGDRPLATVSSHTTLRTDTELC
jgi:hypothetical protein